MAVLEDENEVLRRKHTLQQEQINQLRDKNSTLCEEIERLRLLLQQQGAQSNCAAASPVDAMPQPLLQGHLPKQVIRAAGYETTEMLPLPLASRWQLMCVHLKPLRCGRRPLCCHVRS